MDIIIAISNSKVTLPKHVIGQNKSLHDRQKYQVQSAPTPDFDLLTCRRVICKMMGYDLSFLIKYLLFIQGIETNPGPSYTIVKSIQGDFNQGDKKFGATAGSQCAINSLVAICFSTIKKISFWSNIHLNFVLESGDTVYKNKGYVGYLTFQEMPDNIFLRGTQFSIVQLLQSEHEITKELELTDNVLSHHFWNKTFIDNLRGSDGAIIVINSFMFMIKLENKFFYLFDSHSRDKQGIQSNDGTSIVLKFKDIFEIKKYLRQVYLTESNQTKLWFQLQFFKCLCENDKSELISSFKSYQNKWSSLKYRSKKNDNIKRKVIYHQNKDNGKLEYFDQLKKSRSFYQQNKDQVLDEAKTHYKKNKDESSSQYFDKLKEFRSFYQQNKDKILDEARSFYQQNKDDIKSSPLYNQQLKNQTAFYQQNKDDIKSSPLYNQQLKNQTAFYQQNKDDIKSSPLYNQQLKNQTAFYQQNKDDIKSSLLYNQQLKKQTAFYQQNKDDIKSSPQYN